MTTVLCFFYISHNKVSLNSKNNITQTRKKYNIIYYSLHCRPLDELGHYNYKNKLFSYLILTIDLLIDFFY